MRQWRRFCKSHNHCGECEFDGKGICGEAHLTDIPYADIELRIMSWAAEHPEPVYPSVAKYLEQFGIIIRRDGTLEADFFKANEPMSTDIAQKLGIEPKGE
jgi:hypothetical protein